MTLPPAYNIPATRRRPLRMDEWASIIATADEIAVHDAARAAIAGDRWVADPTPQRRLEATRARNASLRALRNEAILHAMFDLGPRVHELKLLRFENIELRPSGSAIVTLVGKRKASPPGHGLEKEARPKPLRTCGLRPVSVQAIRNWLQQIPKTWPDDGYVWTAGGATPLSEDTIARVLHLTAVDAGIQRPLSDRPMDSPGRKYLVHVHAVRKLVERSILKDVPIEQVAKFHGHDPETLNRYYNEIGEEEVDMILDAKERALSAAQARVRAHSTE